MAARASAPYSLLFLRFVVMLQRMSYLFIRAEIVATVLCCLRIALFGPFCSFPRSSPSCSDLG